jgi:hypothetical protein
MSGSVKTAAQLLTEFADGQVAGAITPGDVRDIIASIGAVAGQVNQVPVYQAGNGGTAITINPTNSHIQNILLNSASPCVISIANGNEIANTRIKMELYVTQTASGNGSVSWGTGISWNGATPQVGSTANGVYLFNIVSIDGGTTWSIV